ncbi:MAG: MBL fold metallo-hydrolase RNA specificity domain-containing protein, partial [Terriglobales bacterium]
LGNRDKPILNQPVPAPPADFVVMESTYGDRNHKSQADSIAEFRQVIQTTLARGGNIVIPTFALERAQDLLYYLREMLEAKLLAPQTPVFLDSPMAISATDIFRRHTECFNPNTAALLTSGHDPFALPHASFTRDGQASRAIANVSGAIIMAGSGMATGGRILHHLVNNLPEERNSILFVGYAAAGTPARKIIEGAHEIKLYGEVVPVRAQIHTIGGFSAHAGHDDLLAWVKSSRAQRIFLVHGEASAAQVLARDLNAAGLTAQIPRLGQSVNLGDDNAGEKVITGP